MAKLYWPWCDDSLKVDDSLVKYSSRRTGYKAGGVDSIGRIGKLGPCFKSISTKSRSRLPKVESSTESIGNSGSVSPMRLMNLHEEQLQVKP
jgi:hypothetical protein